MKQIRDFRITSAGDKHDVEFPFLRYEGPGYENKGSKVQIIIQDNFNIRRTIYDCLFIACNSIHSSSETRYQRESIYRSVDVDDLFLEINIVDPTNEFFSFQRFFCREWSNSDFRFVVRQEIRKLTDLQKTKKETLPGYFLSSLLFDAILVNEHNDYMLSHLNDPLHPPIVLLELNNFGLTDKLFNRLLKYPGQIHFIEKFPLGDDTGLFKMEVPDEAETDRPY
jgi:hypothetical protein